MFILAQISLLLPTLVLLWFSTKRKQRMNFFKKQTSNDYYDSYKKVELGVGEQDISFFSLNNIIKLEFFTLIAGLLFMSFNSFFTHFSIEINDNAFTQKFVLVQNKKSNNVDSKLVSQLQKSETDTIENVKIKEDDSSEFISKLTQNSTYKPEDIALLVEIIKSQMNTNTSTIREDSIVISQN